MVKLSSFRFLCIENDGHVDGGHNGAYDVTGENFGNLAQRDMQLQLHARSVDSTHVGGYRTIGSQVCTSPLLFAL